MSPRRASTWISCVECLAAARWRDPVPMLPVHSTSTQHADHPHPTNPLPIKGERSGRSRPLHVRAGRNDRWLVFQLPKSRRSLSPTEDRFRSRRACRVPTAQHRLGRTTSNNPKRLLLASAGLTSAGPSIDIRTTAFGRFLPDLLARFFPQKLRPYISPYMAAADARTGRLRN